MDPAPHDDCILHQISTLLREDHGLKAIWLDAREKKISFAYQAGTDVEATREHIEKITSRHMPHPEKNHPDDPLIALCNTCSQNDLQAVPPGLRLVAMPGSGIMVEKESCATAPRFWKWHQFPWIKIEPRHLFTPAHAEDLAEWKKAMLAAALCGIGTASGFALEKMIGPQNVWAITAYGIAYLSGAWYPALEVWELLRKRILDVHFLMVCVAVGAALIGHWWEGAVLLFLFSSSGALEDLAMARTEREIQSLFKETPKEANVVQSDGLEKKLPVESLQPGMILRTRPGEQFAVDAEVVSGSTGANESSLTGESVPVDKNPGDPVYSGTLNLWGSVDIRVSKAASESSLAKIIRLIQEAQESKAPSQRFTDKFGTGYTYGVLGLSLLMFLIWWLALGVPPFADSALGKSAFYRAMTLLVVASPCALVLSIPSAILAGIAAGARKGVLFRGGAAIEKLAEITRVALDKTGTLTTGDLEVIGIETSPPGQESELLALAASLAHHSAHPVSRAIGHKARANSVKLVPVENFRSLTGLGVTGQILGQDITLGRRNLFPETGWATSLPLPEIGVTEALVESGTLQGRLLLCDSIRASSAPLLAELQSKKLRVTMLTGDREEAAHTVAQQVGLNDYRAGLHPDEKVSAIREWQAAGEKVAMVGDGVNDAPCLAAAHVAVGMGLRGSDAVLEIADVILTQDRLENFKFAYDLSCKANRIIKQNLAISLGVIVVLVLGALGSWLPLTLGVIGHEGSTVIVVLNSLRLLFFVEKK